MRLPLLTALIVCGIVVYLVQVHRDLVAHQALLHELLERMGALQRMSEMCPPPGTATTAALAPAPAPAASSTLLATAAGEDVPVQSEPEPEPEPEPTPEQDLDTVDSTEMSALLDMIDQEEQEQEQDSLDASLAEIVSDLMTCTEADIDAMPFAQLKALMKNAGLTTKGSRAALRERIFEARNSSSTTSTAT